MCSMSKHNLDTRNQRTEPASLTQKDTDIGAGKVQDIKIKRLSTGIDKDWKIHTRVQREFLVTSLALSNH